MLALTLGSVVAPTSGSPEARLPAPVSRPISDDLFRLAPIVERARRGDPEAFGRLYDHFQSSVYRFVYGQTRSTPLTEDLTADTFFRALRGIQDFKLEPELFAPWLYRIARNLVIDHFKASKTRLERADDMTRHEDIADDTDTEFMALLTRERVRAAVAELPEGQRRVIELRFLAELSISEVADRLDNTQGAVKQLQFRGLRNLAKSMGD